MSKHAGVPNKQIYHISHAGWGVGGVSTPTPAPSPAPNGLVVPYAPSSKGCSSAGSLDAQGIGQLDLCSLKIHFTELFLWTAKIPVLAGELGGAGNFTSPKSDLGLKTPRLLCLPSRPPFSLWKDPQPFYDGVPDPPFLGNPGPSVSTEG